MPQLDSRIRVLTGDFRKSVAKLESDVSAKAVHRLRTTIRRLESLIAFTSPEPGKKEKKTLERLGNLRKQAGRVRDMDIQIGLLGSIANGSTAMDRRAIAERLQSKRTRQAERLIEATRQIRGSRLFERLQKVTAQVPLRNLDEPVADALQEARLRLAELAKSIPARQNLKSRRLHELRIALKHIRYTAELAEDTENKLSFLDELKTVQDAIGEWHDWETLLKTTEKYFNDRVNCPLVVEMRSLFAARYVAATSAASRLLTKYSPAASRKATAAIVLPSDLAKPA